MVLFDRSTQIKIDTRAPASNSLYILPYAATPPLRPQYLGPVVIQIPDTQLANVRMDGTTSGGGGLVDMLDFVWTERGQYALRAGTYVSLFGGANVTPGAVQPASIGSAVQIPSPAVSAVGSAPLPTGSGYTSYTSIYTTGMTFMQVLRAVPAGNILTLPAGTYTIGSDFDPNTDYTCCKVPTNVAGIWGAGPDATILQMAANTSTAASVANSQPAFGTNPCQLMRVLHSNFVFKNLQVKATAQGHTYGGVQFGDGSIRYQTGITVDTVKVVGVPGSTNYPPGETFQMDFNWNDGAQILNCEYDGQGVAAANLGFNNCTNSYVQDTYTHDSGHSHGITWWRCHNIHTLRVRAHNNGAGSGNSLGVGLNHEQTDGTVLHESVTIDCGYTTTTNGGLHMRWVNDDGSHTGAVSVAANGVTHDPGPDPGGCFSVYNSTGTPMTIIKNGVTLARRTSGTGNPATDYFVYPS